MKIKETKRDSLIIHSRTVHEIHHENNRHDHVVILGQSGEEKDDQVVNANCKIVFVAQYLKQCKLVPYNSFHRILPESDELSVELLSQNGQLVGLSQMTRDLGKRERRLIEFLDSSLGYYLLLGSRREWTCVRSELFL